MISSLSLSPFSYFIGIIIYFTLWIALRKQYIRLIYETWEMGSNIIEISINPFSDLIEDIDKFIHKVNNWIKAEHHHPDQKEYKEQNTDNTNYITPILEGIGGGFVIGLILGFIVQIGYCVSSPQNHETIVPALVLFSATLIGGVLGAKNFFYSSKKNEKYKVRRLLA